MSCVPRAKFWASDLYGVCAQSVGNGIVSFQCESVSVQRSHGLADSLPSSFGHQWRRGEAWRQFRSAYTVVVVKSHSSSKPWLLFNFQMIMIILNKMYFYMAK